MDRKQNWELELYLTNLTEAESDALLDQIILIAESHGGTVSGLLDLAKSKGESNDEQVQAT